MGLNFPVYLTRQGHVYTYGTDTRKQLGHGDTVVRPKTTIIKPVEGADCVVQIAAGPSYVLFVTDNCAVHSFGFGSNFYLGHGEQHDEFQPHMIQTLRRNSIHVVCLSAGDDPAVALGSIVFFGPRVGCIYLGERLLRSIRRWR